METIGKGQLIRCPDKNLRARAAWNSFFIAVDIIM